MSDEFNLGNIFILGDSYSTFEGCVVPGHACWYVKNPRDNTDVRSADELWWSRLLSEVEGKIILNSSWSGTTICHTGYDGADRSTISFVARLDDYIKDGFFRENKVDTLFIFGGTNDNWANSPIGEIMLSDWKREDLYNALPAFAYLMSRVKTEIADARPIVLINCHLKKEIEEGYINICNHFGVEYILFENINKISGHPSVLGMKQIAQQIQEYIVK